LTGFKGTFEKVSRNPQPDAIFVDLSHLFDQFQEATQMQTQHQQPPSGFPGPVQMIQSTELVNQGVPQVTTPESVPPQVSTTNLLPGLQRKDSIVESDF